MGAIAPLSIDTYLPSLPTIAHELAASARAVQASVAIFFAGMAVGQLFYGPASDRIGRRIPVILGLAVYFAGSVGCALAPDVGMLIAARLAQALGGCAGAVIVRAIVRDHFEHQEAARFFSLLALMTGMAPILAPLGGSALLQLSGWRSIFGFLAAYGGVLCFAALVMLPESRSAEIARHARDEHPLRSYVAILRNRRLIGYIGAGAFNGAMLFTYVASSASVLMGPFRISPQRYAVLIGLNAVGLIAASQLNRILLRRRSADRVLSAATIASVAVTALLAAVSMTGIGGLPGLLVLLFLTIASFSLVQANAMAGALSVDPMRAGVTSALFGACSFAAGALAAALAGALFDGTARPMAFVIMACSIGCAISARSPAVAEQHPHSRGRNRAS